MSKSVYYIMYFCDCLSQIFSVNGDGRKKAAVCRDSPQTAASLNSSQISLFSVCLLPQIISNACKTK